MKKGVAYKNKNEYETFNGCVNTDQKHPRLWKPIRVIRFSDKYDLRFQDRRFELLFDLKLLLEVQLLLEVESLLEVKLLFDLELLLDVQLLFKVELLLDLEL